MKENNKKPKKTKETGKAKKTGSARLMEMSVMLSWEFVLENNRDKLRGGPGLTQETAWEILETSSPEAVELEYDVMRELSLPRASRQKLVVDEDGRRYDVHEIGEGEKESDKLQMWFDITAYWENLGKKKTQTKRERKRERKEKVRRIQGLTDISVPRKTRSQQEVISE